MGKVALILGVLGMLLGGGVLLVSVLLPPLTDGRTSWEEAMLGSFPARWSCCVRLLWRWSVWLLC